MAMNSFLGRKEVVEILLSNKKADALLTPTTKRLIAWWGVISLSLFGYPQSVSSRTRMQDIFKMMSSLPKGSLVDIGCSFGAAHTFELARRFAPHPVLGLDIDPISIDVAKRLNQVLGFDNLTFEVTDILKEEGISRQFDIAFSLEMLGNIPDDVGALQNINRLIKPRGWLVLSVIYNDVTFEFESPKPVFKSVGGADTSNLFEGGYHWRSGYNEERLNRLLDSAGFEILSLMPTKSINILPSTPYLFPVGYLLSKLATPFWGRTKKINLVARKREK